MRINDSSKREHHDYEPWLEDGATAKVSLGCSHEAPIIVWVSENATAEPYPSLRKYSKRRFLRFHSMTGGLGSYQEH